MIKDTIESLEKRLRDAGNMDADKRAELLGLLESLKREVDELSKTHAEEARSIVGFADVSAHEATRLKRNDQLVEHALSGLTASVEEFEQSHPKLVEVANNICVTLSNLGI